MTVLLAACSQSHPKPAKTPAPPSYILYSPNAEPLNGGDLGKPTCEKALSEWFDRMAAGEDHISKESFMADAAVQFSKMDIDKNGYLVSEELDRYRQPYRQEAPAAKTEPEQEKASKNSHKRKSGGGSDKKDSDALAHLTDPVMSADTNLDFQVTLAEFTSQAQDNFSKLDSNHDNVLSREEILVVCHVEEKH